MCLCVAHRHGSMNSRSEVGESTVAPRAVTGSELGYKLLECLGYPVYWFGRSKRSIRRATCRRCCRRAFFLYARVLQQWRPRPWPMRRCPVLRCDQRVVSGAGSNLVRGGAGTKHPDQTLRWVIGAMQQHIVVAVTRLPDRSG